MVLEHVIDTNLLVYAHDRRDRLKQRRARDLLRELARSGTAAVPAQALAELSSVLLRRFKPPVSPAEVAGEVERLAATFTVLALTPQVVLEALRGVRDHRFNFYDAQIWAAARLSQAPLLLTEDFTHGQTRDGVTFVNPFNTTDSKS